MLKDLKTHKHTNTRQLCKNAASNIEQVPESTPHKTAAVRPPTTQPRKLSKLDETRHTGYCWRSMGELISDILLWIPSLGRAKAGRPAGTYTNQPLCDTGYSLESLPGAINDRDGWRERVREIHAGSAK